MSRKYIMDEPKTVSRKAIYETPKLVVYGQLSRLTRGTQNTGNDADNTPTRNTQSDARLKENIVHIDNHPMGFGLYLFDYKQEFKHECGSGRRFGVIADEVEAVLPGAVSIGADGYRRVDYAMIGIKLNR